MNSRTIITPINTTVDVVTVQEAKDHCNCDVDTFDALFTGWIAAARMALQVFTNQAFLPSNVTYYVENDGFHGWYAALPYANNAVLTGDSATKYELKGERVYTTDPDMSLTYTAGTAPEQWMKQSALMYVADLYENRGEGQNTKIGEAAKQYCKGFINHGMFF